jgi:small subunit ribosomal protein S20|tara:strand:- start:71 stop:235 length:165 start_codon:yes stop_codon:yes gene_type:complete
MDEALKGNNKPVAEETLKKVSSLISKGASKGVLRKRTASRKISRLSKKVRALAS